MIQKEVCHLSVNWEVKLPLQWSRRWALAMSAIVSFARDMKPCRWITQACSPIYVSQGC